MSELLQTHDLAIGYASRRGAANIIVDHIDVALRPGQLTCLVGPNGAGKSTLIRTLAGMQAPIRGRVTLGNADLHRLPAAELARQLAVVLTERVEVGNLTAYALVALGRHPYTNWRDQLTELDVAAVQNALTMAGAAHLAARPLQQLSDGERQRVMIARALAQEPQVLILDEPTAFLDLPRRVETMRLLGTLARNTQSAILLSTHDLDLALRVADQLWLLPTGKPLITGLPEELALSGALADAFRSEGVEFDNNAGAFKIQRHPCGPIGLSGEGLTTHWTGRALERIGFDVVTDAMQSDIQPIYRVGVVGTNGATRWQVTTPERHCEHSTLHETIDCLANVYGATNQSTQVGSLK